MNSEKDEDVDYSNPSCYMRPVLLFASMGTSSSRQARALPLSLSLSLSAPFLRQLVCDLCGDSGGVQQRCFKPSPLSVAITGVKWRQAVEQQSYFIDTATTAGLDGTRT